MDSAKLPTADITINALIAQRPALSPALKKLGIDICRNGFRSLQEVCDQMNLDAASVLSDLLMTEAVADSHRQDEEPLSLIDLIDQIEQIYHARFKQELPRLGTMVRKVAAVHGNRYPWMLEIDGVFARFAAGLNSHMLKEEQLLFPLIRCLVEHSKGPADDCDYDIANPIRVMQHEHDDAAHDLARMRQLSNGFTPPSDACHTFYDALHGLRTLAAEIHQYIRQENDILFPKAMDLEHKYSPKTGEMR